jgi:hypothetical protein
MPRSRFLRKGLTLQRARVLVKELGFLGIVDLLTVQADTIDGALECAVPPRVFVQIKKRPKEQKRAL